MQYLSCMVCPYFLDRLQVKGCRSESFSVPIYHPSSINSFSVVLQYSAFPGLFRSRSPILASTLLSSLEFGENFKKTVQSLKVIAKRNFSSSGSALKTPLGSSWICASLSRFSRVFDCSQRLSRNAFFGSGSNCDIMQSILVLFPDMSSSGQNGLRPI